MKKSELEYFNGVLDRECQKLMQETNILKGIISNMLMNNEQSTLMFKLITPDPMHIKIENDMCIITRGLNDATMQTENK